MKQTITPKVEVKHITPIPYMHAPVEGGDYTGLVIVSLEQLIEVQKKIERLEHETKHQFRTTK